MSIVDHYNSAPEGLIEMSLKDWSHGFFMYQLEPYEGRQVMTPERFDLRMFDIPNFENKKLGFAIKRQFVNREPITTFCRYGLEEDWKKFTNRFAAQFAGDNS